MCTLQCDCTVTYLPSDFRGGFYTGHGKGPFSTPWWSSCSFIRHFLLCLKCQQLLQNKHPSERRLGTVVFIKRKRLQQETFWISQSRATDPSLHQNTEPTQKLCTGLNLHPGAENGKGLIFPCECVYVCPQAYVCMWVCVCTHTACVGCRHTCPTAHRWRPEDNRLNPHTLICLR